MLKTYDEKVKNIQNELVSIGHEVINSLELSFQGIKDNDLSKLKNLDLSVKKISTKTNEIDNQIIKTLALYAPEARDLREVVSYFKITNELVRASASTKIFAKSFRNSYSEKLDTKTLLELIIPLHKSTKLAFETAIFMINEAEQNKVEQFYDKVTVEEAKTDDLYMMLEKSILKLISNNVELSKDYLHILSSLRKLEKIADRASSIANLVLFARVGGEL